MLGELRLPNNPRSAATARRFIRLVTATWQLTHIADDAELLVSELVSNAVVHAQGVCESTVRVLAIRDGERLRVEVHDPSHQPPTRRHADTLAESGRGLGLIEDMADRHGTYPTPFGKAVWYELIAWPFADDTLH